MTAGAGSISAGLLASLASRMRFRLGDHVEATGEDVEFQDLGLTFAMGPSGELSIRGALGAEYARDAVIVRGDWMQPVARAPEGAANVGGSGTR